MGRKKSFIDKKNSVTYALMARPEGEADPSGEAREAPQVWMRKDRNHHARDALAEAGGGDDGSVFDESSMETGTTYSGATGYSAYSSMSDVTFVMGPNGPVPRRERLSREKRRELRELGFDPNDGYDYTRHLRRVGEGGGVMFVPDPKDHVKEFATRSSPRAVPGNAAWTKNRCFSARTSSATAPPPSPSVTSEGAPRRRRRSDGRDERSQGGDGRQGVRRRTIPSRTRWWRERRAPLARASPRRSSRR